MAPISKTCTRSGCGKKLRPNNTTGECGSGCLSMEAPPAKRASQGGEEDVLVRFRKVAKALGKDPDEILENSARKVAAQWLQTLEEAIK